MLAAIVQCRYVSRVNFIQLGGGEVPNAVSAVAVATAAIVCGCHCSRLGGKMCACYCGKLLLLVGNDTFLPLVAKFVDGGTCQYRSWMIVPGLYA